jgi:hypothetical protein
LLATARATAYNAASQVVMISKTRLNFFLISGVLMAQFFCPEIFAISPRPSCAWQLEHYTPFEEREILFFENAFSIRPTDKRIIIFVDLPSRDRPILENEENVNWLKRIQMAQSLALAFQQRTGKEVVMVAYDNVGRKNAPLPPHGWTMDFSKKPVNFDEIFDAITDNTFNLDTKTLKTFPIIVALNHFSMSATLEPLTNKEAVRAASMPGFTQEMLPALSVPVEKIKLRTSVIAERLKNSKRIEIKFSFKGKNYGLKVPINDRKAFEDNGILTQDGVISNIPAGETYLVPYEGEKGGVTSEGEFPVWMEDNVFLYVVKGGNVVDVKLLEGDPAAAAAHLAWIQEDPMRGHIAEMGFGILGSLGLEMLPNRKATLYNEKIFFHIGRGKSAHFEGGQVGDKDFLDPSHSFHDDLIFGEAAQPGI